MTQTEKLYKPLDDFLKRLKKKIKEVYAPLFVSGFDQLNIIRLSKQTEDIYNELDRYNRKAYKELMAHAQKWAESMIGRNVKIDVDQLMKDYLAGYDPVTQYVYDREIERKRMRLNESILTAREYQDIVKLQKAVKKAADLWYTQSSQYALDLMDLALTCVFEEDDDVKFFRWNAVIDGHECDICHERDGKVYPEDAYPEKPHYGCRCYKSPAYNAVKGDERE